MCTYFEGCYTLKEELVSLEEDALEDFAILGLLGVSQGHRLHCEVKRSTHRDSFAHFTRLLHCFAHGFGDELMVLVDGFTWWHMVLVILCLFWEDVLPFMHTS